MKNFLKTSLALTLLAFATTSACHAAAAVPEIDAQSGTAAIALITGAFMVLRSRRK